MSSTLTISTKPGTSARGSTHTLLLAMLAFLAGCGSTPRPAPMTGIPKALLREARPIGAGPRFQPPATGPISGPCHPGLGRHYPVHIEVFAANKVVIIPAGIGTRPPRTLSAGRITRARCYGDLVTLEPTGVVLVRTGSRSALSDLFRSWGQRLSTSQLASFRTGPRAHVAVFIDGHRSKRLPGQIALTPHAEIVIEVGPYVPPHNTYTFPPGT